mmetsp:Transcript_11450/g.34571  ORF Transcript_11450/g.34571 Transcript_11450/m.34571 type:complete len:254 (-) Transcript_11450:170-931(-)
MSKALGQASREQFGCDGHGLHGYLTHANARPLQLPHVRTHLFGGVPVPRHVYEECRHAAVRVAAHAHDLRHDAAEVGQAAPGQRPRQAAHEGPARGCPQREHRRSLRQALGGPHAAQGGRDPRQVRGCVPAALAARAARYGRDHIAPRTCRLPQAHLLGQPQAPPKVRGRASLEAPAIRPDLGEEVCRLVLAAMRNEEDAPGLSGRPLPDCFDVAIDALVPGPQEGHPLRLPVPLSLLLLFQGARQHQRREEA